MKKILSIIVLAFAFVASANAQFVKVYKNNVLCRVYDQQAHNYEVTFEEHKAQGEETQGNGKISVYEDGVLKESFVDSEGSTYKVTTAEDCPPGALANHNGDQIFVEYVQLWDGGPKWATFNVGATNLGELGNHYYYGKATPQEVVASSEGCYFPQQPECIQGTEHDAAKLVWGDNWVMSTDDQYQQLWLYTDSIYVENYKNTGLYGYVFRGQGNYSDKSIFIPVTPNISDYTYYWTAICGRSGKHAVAMYLGQDHMPAIQENHNLGNACYIRAVLKEEESQGGTE